MVFATLPAFGTLGGFIFQDFNASIVQVFDLECIA